MTPENPCPCGSILAYEHCCAPYHLGRESAPDAVSLMRSRYSAFALGQVDYLLNTTHREHPQARKNIKVWRAEVLAYCRSTRFVNLTVTESLPGEELAFVTFQAELQREGMSFILSEKSRFVKLGRRWLYHSGDSEITRLS